MNTFSFGSQGVAQGRSTDYIKDLPQGSLHVHAPNGVVTGAKLYCNDGTQTTLSNYEAAMLDLQAGVVRKNTGNF